MIFMIIRWKFKRMTISKGCNSSRKRDISQWLLKSRLSSKTWWFLKITLDIWEPNWRSKGKSQEVKICKNLSFKRMCHMLVIGWTEPQTDLMCQELWKVILSMMITRRLLLDWEFQTLWSKGKLSLFLILLILFLLKVTRTKYLKSCKVWGMMERQKSK
jgi:hypothetical protein